MDISEHGQKLKPIWAFIEGIKNETHILEVPNDGLNGGHQRL